MTNDVWTSPETWDGDDIAGHVSTVATVLLIGAVALGAGLVGGVWALEKVLGAAGDRLLGTVGSDGHPNFWGTVDR